MADVAITIAKINKTFRLPHERATGLKQAMVTFYRRKRGYEIQQVLKNIDFKIQAGEFFGIVGRNGSGKSTLLKLLAGVYVPDSGMITINGSLTPFIELGVGFNPELTGRENVFLNGALLGFNHRQMEAMYHSIVEFAELEQFMDQKLKNYSSGMQVRLAFSIAIRANSDILLLDEVLAVGDAIFQKKCYDYFRQLKKEGRTVVFVSHDISALEQYCDRGVLIERGKVIEQGDIRLVTKRYVDLLQEQEAEQGPVAKRGQRSGNGTVEVIGLDFVGHDIKAPFTDRDDWIEFDVQYRAAAAAVHPVYGVTINDAAGERVFVSNTIWRKVATASLEAGQEVTVRWRLPNVLNTGEFSVTPAVTDQDGLVLYDSIEGMAALSVTKQLRSNTLVNVNHTITLTPRKDHAKN